MPKDIIFSNAPKKQKQPRGNPSEYFKHGNRQTFLKSELNLNEWRKLEPNEILQKGDIFLCDDTYVETDQYNGHQNGLNTYYRRKECVMDICDSDRYDILSPNETLQKGDEFLDDRNGKWFPTHISNLKVGTLMLYRRPKSEISKAKQHYDVGAVGAARGFKRYKPVIDLSQHIQLVRGDQLQRGDEWFDETKNSWEPTMYVGHDIDETTCKIYRRRKK